jgi:hypothetical protein
MKKTKVLLAATAAVLVLAGAAVPAVAGLLGREGQHGSVRLYTYAIAGRAADGSPQYAPIGPSPVCLTYEARVNPGSLSWTLAAARLAPSTSYSLVALVDFWGSATFDFNFWQVDVLATQSTNRRGVLTMRGSGETLREPAYTSWPYRYNYWYRFSGAELWLVPSADIEMLPYKTKTLQVLRAADGPRGFAVRETWWLASLGLPADPADFNIYGGSAGTAPAAPAGIDKPAN